MYNIDKFLGDKTKNVINMIYEILLITKEHITKFPASTVAQRTGLSTQEMGGGWTSLTMRTNNMPPLLLKAGKVLEKNVNGKRSYTPLWRINKEVDWEGIEKQIKNFNLRTAEEVSGSARLLKGKGKYYTMRNPNLENMWETAIKVDKDTYRGANPKIIMEKVIPTILALKEKCGIKWYCFLFHNKRNGYQINQWEGYQFHIRFEKPTNLSIDQLISSIPNYCETPRRIEMSSITSISGVDKSIIKNQDISEAWRLLGGLSEYLIDMLNSHTIKNSEDYNKLEKNISLFEHFMVNMTNIYPNQN